MIYVCMYVEYKCVWYKYIREYIGMQSMHIHGMYCTIKRAELKHFKFDIRTNRKHIKILHSVNLH